MKEDGYTALYTCALSGNIPTAKVLVEFGADMKTKGTRGVLLIAIVWLAAGTFLEDKIFTTGQSILALVSA